MNSSAAKIRCPCRAIYTRSDDGQLLTVVMYQGIINTSLIPTRRFEITAVSWSISTFECFEESGVPRFINKTASFIQLKQLIMNSV